MINPSKAIAECDDATYGGKSGNSSENPKAFIFLMDYAHSRRIKLWGTLRVVEDDPALFDHLRDPSYPGKVERAIMFMIEAKLKALETKGQDS